MKQPNLRVLGSNILNIIETTQGIKNDVPRNKTSKAIPAKIFFHIYKQTNTHIKTFIVQLIADAFFFGI